MEGPPLGPGGEDITWTYEVAPRGRKASSTRKIKPQTSNLVSGLWRFQGSHICANPQTSFRISACQSTSWIRCDSTVKHGVPIHNKALPKRTKLYTVSVH